MKFLSQFFSLTALCLPLVLTSCSKEKTQVELRCKGKPDYERCISDEDYFISLMDKKHLFDDDGFFADQFNQEIKDYNKYANQWIGNTKIKRSSLKTPRSADEFLEPLEAMLVSDENMARAIQNSKNVYAFKGHFTSGEESESGKIFLNVHPLSDSKSIGIDSFGFGTKEQDALKLCDFLLSYDLPKGEAVCPALFIVSSSLKSDIAPSIKELVYHLEAMKYSEFVKSDFFERVEKTKILELREMFEKHLNQLSKSK